VLAVLTCLLFAPALTDPGSVLYFRDVSQNHHPYRQLTVSTIASGEAPLWNPWRGSGQPLLANPNALILHPTTLLFLVLPFAAAFKLSVIVQYFIAAAGVWLVLRDAGASRGGALTGACVFAFCGYTASLGNLINLLDSAAFMPLTVWLASRALTRGFAPWGSLAALSLAVQLLSGEPALLACTLLALSGMHWSFPQARTDGDGGAASLGRRLAILAGIGLLSVALAMCGVLPTLELLVRSERASGFEASETLKWSRSPSTLVETVAPSVFGDPTRLGPTGFRAGKLFDTGVPLILSIYLGPAALILAGLGWSRGFRGSGARRAEALAAGALAAGGAALSLGRFLPLYPVLLTLIPPLTSVRYPVKYFVLVVWAVSLMSARGYDALCRREPARTGPAGRLLRPLGAGVAVAVVVALLLAVAAQPVAPAGTAILHAAVSACLALWLAGAGSAVVRRFGLAALVAADLVIASMPLNPVAPPAFYTTPPALEREIHAGASGRLWATPRPKGFAFRTPLAPWLDPGSLASGFLWDRYTLRNATYFPERLRFAYDRGNERLDVMPGAALGKVLYEEAGGALPPDRAARLLTVAGVGSAITYGGLTIPGFTPAGKLEGLSNVAVVVMSDPAPLPRAYVASRVEIRPEIERALERLRDPTFDPRREVILEEGSAPADTDRVADGDAGIRPARIVEETSLRVGIEIDADRAGYLVLTDTYYPGWKATVDGREAAIVRANTMFRAVAVPGGHHRIEFVYAPSTVRSGLMVTAAAILLAGLLAVPRRR